MISLKSFVFTTSVVLLGMGSTTTSLAATASTYGVAANGALTIMGGMPRVDASENTGWQTIAPAKIDIAETTSGDNGAYALSQMHVSTSYGLISANGDGTLTNAPYFGALISQKTAARGGDPNGHFFDRLTVRSDSLAVGTPVTVSFSLLMQGHVFGSYNDGPFAGADVVGALYSSTAGNPNAPWLTVGLSEETAYDTFQSGVINTRVGNSFSIQGRLWISMGADANGSVPLGEVRTRTFDYDARLLFGIESAPNTYLVADSGTQYVAAVPEPETYAMFLAGLGIMGSVARLRKQQA